MKLSVTISGLTRLYGDDLAAMLDTARLADEAGVDLDRTVASVPALAALGVTTVSVGLGGFLRTAADVEPFLRSLATALRDV